jgi:hypothetical protein
MTSASRRGWARAAIVVGTALLVASCGSDSVSTTTGGTGVAGTTVLGPLVAELSASCPGFAASALDYASGAGVSSPDQALQQFLTTPAGASVRGETFDPAQPPPSSPVQSVVGSPGVATATTAPTYRGTPPTLTEPAPRWYAHRDADGRVTAVIEVSALDPAHWTVDELRVCTTGPDAGGATETTMSFPPPTAAP